MSIKSINPFDFSLDKEYEAYDLKKIDQYLLRAEEAFETWKNVSFSNRAKLFLKCAEYLKNNKESLGRIIVSEMGKPIRQAKAEIEKCAWACEFYANQAEGFLRDEFIVSTASKSFISCEALGAVLAIMPWNFPFWQVFRFAAPALMAGNVGLLKHASNVPKCALAIEKCFVESGFPQGVFQTLLIGPDKIEYLISNNVVKAVTLTGSEKAGSEVAALAGKNIKKSVLELGGSDAFIVLEDADIDKAAATAVQSRMQNAGQSCIAAKRFIVVEKVFEEFLQKMKDKVTSIKLGDPEKQETDMGPMARKDLVDSLMLQILESEKKGAKIFLGGKRPERDGAFMEPTILTEVKSGMPAYEEELFGPVASVIKVRDDEEAVKIANDSRYGLGASIWTKDIERGERLARRIESGAVFINGMVSSDPRLPFGGIKMSGYGRELSYQGIREFVNIKTVWVG